MARLSTVCLGRGIRKSGTDKSVQKYSNYRRRSFATTTHCDPRSVFLCVVRAYEQSKTDATELINGVSNFANSSRYIIPSIN